MPSDATNWIGRNLGGYQIESIVGSGGTADVYRAFQPQLDRWVAIKVLKTRNVANRKFLERFRQEAKAIALLRHPNILTVYDYGEEDGMAYIVMEYVSGGTLDSLLTDTPQQWADLAPLLVPVAQALDYAHSQGMVHCDVKPGNILLARPDWALLADFGLMRLLEITNMTEGDDAITGTPAYLAPEQITGKPVDHRTDIYALAVVLYELVTGQLPFTGETSLQVMLSRLHEDPIPPATVAPHIPAELNTILLQAMARDPNGRFASITEFVDALLSIAQTGQENGRPPTSDSLTATTVFSTTNLFIDKSHDGPHLVATGTGTPLALPATKEEVFIGRSDPRLDKQPDVDLGPHGGDVAGVSRIHARLRHSQEGWWLQDLGSTNGTYVNSLRLAPRQPTRIRSGDTLRCGKMSLAFFED